MKIPKRLETFKIITSEIQCCLLGIHCCWQENKINPDTLLRCISGVDTTTATSDIWSAEECGDLSDALGYDVFTFSPSKGLCAGMSVTSCTPVATNVDWQIYKEECTGKQLTICCCFFLECLPVCNYLFLFVPTKCGL